MPDDGRTILGRVSLGEKSMPQVFYPIPALDRFGR